MSIFVKKKRMQKNLIGDQRNTFTTKLLMDTANIIVKKFVKNGSLNYNNSEDIKHSIIEKYLLKQTKIENAYNGLAKPETYLSAIFYRMILEILRAEKNKIKYNSNTEIKNIEHEHELNPEEKLIINNEKDYLKRVLLTFGKQRVKLNLFLKYYLRLSIVLIDLEQYVPSKIFNKILELLKDNTNIKDKEVYIKLSDTQYLCEKKKVKPDAIRMYINNNIDKILTRLNGNNRAHYSKESFSILFEMTCK